MKKLSSKKSLSKRRKLIILLALIVLVGAGIGAYYYVKYNQEQAEKQAVIDRDSKAALTDKSAKKDSLDETKKTSSSGLPNNSTEMTSDEVATGTALSVAIVSASQANGYVKATANTNGSGTCVFSYRPADDGMPVTRQVEVVGNKCSINISQNEFAYLGSWTLKVTYYSNGTKAEASQNVTIN